MPLLPSPIRTTLRMIPFAGALAVILALALEGGGNTSATAIGASMWLTGLLALAVLLTPARSLGAALRENRLNLAALGVFVLVCLLTAAPAPLALSHPIYGVTGLDHGAVSLNPSRTLEGVAKLLGLAAAFAIGVLAIGQNSDRDVAGWLLALGGMAYAAYAIFDYKTGYVAPHGRLQADFGSPNAVAMLLGLFVLCCAALALRAGRRPERRRPQSPPLGLVTAAGVRTRPVPRVGAALQAVFAIVAAAVIGTALVFTASKGGLLATFAGLVAIGFLFVSRMSRKSYRIPPIWALAAICGGGLLAVVALQLMASQFGALDFVVGRMAAVLAHWEAFLDRPILGHGLNTFAAINTMYGAPSNWNAIGLIGAAHNIVVQHLEETGIVGGLLFAIVLGAPVYRAGAAVLGRRSGHAWSCLALGATLTVFLHGMVDFGLNVPAVGGLYALILGAYTRRGV